MIAVVALTTRIPGLVLTEHEFQVPLDHDQPNGERITVFAREAADPDGLDRPYLVFLTGGPGFEAPRPSGGAPGWLARALRDFRVLLLDQRGTGRSTPVETLPGMTPRQQADHLTHFRADSIVRDAEWIRGELGVDKWSVLGQSFGGFCVLTYLSIAPHGLREALFTGGVPPVGVHIDDVYRATYRTILERNRRYYLRYPGDRDRVRRIVDLADQGRITLADGDRLTARRFRQLGNMLGMSDGAENLHHRLERDPLSYAFAHDVAESLPFPQRNPIYFVLQEACYADGFVTNWAADRMLPDEYAVDPTLFTGEHAYPWMMADCGGFAPLREATALLATHEWPRLYDEAALRSCDVPCAAAMYAEDAFVDYGLGSATARMIPTMRYWVTNEYEHNGLRASGGRVLDRILDLARGRV
jgi:pimeloyl-ACP methyl ester carboxylesterase